MYCISFVQFMDSHFIKKTLWEICDDLNSCNFENTAQFVTGEMFNNNEQENTFGDIP